MMYANQPYQRVDDGVGSGFVGGALLGGGLAAGAHFGTASAISGLKKPLRNAAASAASSIASSYEAGVAPSAMQEARSTIANDRFDRATRAGTAVKGYHKKIFGGGWKGKALAYGGAALGMGVLGMGADALND
jgi:hypothetical protein